MIGAAVSFTPVATPVPYFVYVLSCADGTLYTGITTDVVRRVHEHNESAIGAKYTHTRRPVTLAYTEVCSSRSDALKREIEIKRLSRIEKQKLIEAHVILTV